MLSWANNWEWVGVIYKTEGSEETDPSPGHLILFAGRANQSMETVSKSCFTRNNQEST